MQIPHETIPYSMRFRVQIDPNGYKDLLRFRNAGQVDC